jgi:hypothetical protein
MMTATMRLRFETGISFNDFSFQDKRVRQLVKAKATIHVFSPLFTLYEGGKGRDIDGRSKDGLEQLTVISDLFAAFGCQSYRSKIKPLIPGGNIDPFSMNMLD